jgi:uroporphyrinogen III methyltransferase / synthase
MFMQNSEKVLLTGARDSKLSKAQTRQAITKLEQLVSKLKFSPVWMSSPGDRDRTIDLRKTSPDFFSRDLDDAIINQEIDCAIHSAKDLPEEINENLDVIFLPWREDSRDVIIYPKGKGLVSNPRIGISSERRELYAAKRFPDSQNLTIRGNIDDRIAQLDQGKYDMLIMAAAGLLRLGLAERISEYISLEELLPPSAQGQLALVFKKSNPIFNLLRKLFVKTVVFAGAGIGTKENTTLGAVEAVKHCDVCFYDSLCPQELLKYLPASAEGVYVGKRQGEHSHSQQEICNMLVDSARKGHKVVRLKGGDPGMFGRLAEEIEALNIFELPYRVLPGVSSLAVATTSTGLLLTRRGMSRGFTVVTPRKSGSAGIEWISAEEKKLFPQVFFMGVSELKIITNHLLSDGYSAEMSVSVVFNAGYPDCTVVSGTVGDIAEKLPETSMPGIIIAGNVSDSRFLYKKHGVLNGIRVLFTGSEALQDKAIREILDFGGIPICKPMIKLQHLEGESPLEPSFFEKILTADWLIVNSPSAAELLMNSDIDLRKLPKIAVCGKETAKVFKKYNIYPDICPDQNFGADGLFEAMKNEIKKSDKIIRLCSSNSKTALTEKLKKIAPDSEALLFYRNSPIIYDSLPDFDAVLFTSPSTVKAFPTALLKNKKICVIGKPTEKALLENIPEHKVIKGTEATIADMLLALAADVMNITGYAGTKKIKTLVNELN